MASLTGLWHRALFTLSLMGMAQAFRFVAKRDERLRKNLNGFDAVYQFRSDDRRTARHLIFSNGRVFTRAGTHPSPDFTVMYYDFALAARSFRRGTRGNPPTAGERGGPNILLLLLGGAVEQSGNSFYIFKLGYMSGLVRAYFLRKED